MKSWMARILAVALAAAAAYATAANAHAATPTLECALAATVLTIATIALLWRVPIAAAILNAVWVVAALAASFTFAARHAPTTQPTQSVAAPKLYRVTGALTALQTDTDFSEFLGPGTVASEDALFPKQPGEGAVKSGNGVLSAFGGAAQVTSPPSQTASQLRDLAAQIPEKEYSLDALAPTLPNDPVQLYRFVRDNVDVDLYDGAMRGPLGTWLGRAGSSTDKTLLLAWLFAHKGIHYQFVRGTLTRDERGRIAAEAAAIKPAQPDAQTTKPVDDYVATVNAKAPAFGKWANDLLGRASVATAVLPEPADRITPSHFWIQVDTGGKLLDLDPTLVAMQEGQHLATLDPSFKPSVMLPTDEYHWIQLRLHATLADGSTRQVFVYTARSQDVAYVPIRLIVAPHGAKDLIDVAHATAFDTQLLVGKQVAIGNFDLGTGATAVRELVLDIARKGPNFAQERTRRWLLDSSVNDADRAAHVSGLTTLVVTPGIAGNAYTLRERLLAEAQAFDDQQATAAGQQVVAHTFYPVRVLDYFARDDAVAARSPVRLFRNRPDVAALHTSVSTSGTDLLTTFDIVDDAMSSAQADSRAVFAANVTRGYADAVIERDVIGGSAEYGTPAIFDAATSAGIPPQVLSGTSSSSEALQLGLSDTLAAGRVAIAPKRAAVLGGRTAYGWWDIDPSTGNTVGRMTGGTGGTMAEYGVFAGYTAVLTAAYIRVITGIESFPDCKPGGSATACVKALCKAGEENLIGADGARHAQKMLDALGTVLATFGSGFKASNCGS